MQDFSSIGVIFDPSRYGFNGVYPTDMWASMQAQFSAANLLASGEELDAVEPATGKEKYPLHINLYDFVAELHATMMCGEQGTSMPPRSVFSGDGKRRQKWGDECNRIVEKAWKNSNSALFWTIFYNTQVYGGYPLIARYTKDKPFKLAIEAVHPTNFYPCFDAFGNVIEFFIFRPITHAEAKWRYGVEVSAVEIPYYLEHWDPKEWTIKINGDVALQSNGVAMSGKNPYGVAPAVYIPHTAKITQYGESQILGIREPVLDYNSRLADISDATNDLLRLRYWGKNVGEHEIIEIGNVQIVNFGTSFSEKMEPGVNAFETPKTVKDGLDFITYLWNLILYLSKIPGVALGVDEGSQRSGETMRARFWALLAHASTERMYATQALNELARILIIMANSIGLVSADVSKMEVNQEWPEMLPQERLELVNEMVTRMSAGLVSQRTALRKFSDYDDLEEELALIKQEREDKQKEQMEMQRQSMQAKAEASDVSKKSNDGGDKREVSSDSRKD